MTLQTVGIVGAGAWGTALAIVARRAGRDVLLWAHEPETVADINQRHRNETFLPGIKLDKAIAPSESDLRELGVVAHSAGLELK